MSSRIPRKFLHANKKAWKFFKTTIQTKFANLNSISTTVKRTKKYCSSAFSFIRRRYRDIPRKVQYAFTSSPRRPSSSTSASYNFQHYYSQQSKCRASFSAIYIDELFPEQSIDNNYTEKKKLDHEIGSSALNKAEKRQNRNGNTTRETGETSSAAASGGGAGRKLPMLPQFRGVDERAEEFISKFREEMKLEREKSIIDFQEMLARSS